MPPSGRDNQLAATSVHERLRAAIMSAELRPNRRLVEDDLASWLDTSRTPVREALLRLEQDGLVERDRGWIVRDHHPEDLMRMLEARLMVEGYTARLASQRAASDHIERLSKLADEMEVTGISRLQYNTLNNDFHNLITEAAANGLLAQFHRRTELNYWNLSVPVVFTPEHDRLVNEQHRMLIQAIAEGDGDRAEEVGRSHVQATLDIVLSAVRPV